MPVTLPRRARLGAELPADAQAFTGDGMWIAGVGPDSMAAAAGLQAGDCVRAIAGLPVRTLAELAAALRRAGAESSTAITFTRGDTSHQRAVAVETVPIETTVDGARVELGALAVPGATLRTISTHVERPRALIVVIQGIACESIDHALAPDAPLAGLVAGWTAAGYDTLRFDKRGVGDSEGGPCPRTDFATELADARSATAYATTRGLPLVLFGHSVGGIIAAQLAADLLLAGVMVYGTPVMRWLACLQDSARRQMMLRGSTDDAIAAQVAELARLADTGELNGRSAAYHAQLDALDLEAAWRGVTAPILVVRGEHDWVVADHDQARIADLAAGPTTIVDVPGLDHLFGWHADREASLRDYGIGVFDPAVVDATVAWLTTTV
jgi:alpha-beta hydrolase superfamily lysophospholipase